jgi:amino acid transporter
LFSFLAGVLASVAVNSFTQCILTDRLIVQPLAMATSIILFLLASASAAAVAWYSDDMHSQWLREGRPTEPTDVEDIVRKRRLPTTIALIITVITIIVGGYQLYLAVSL